MQNPLIGCALLYHNEYGQTLSEPSLIVAVIAGGSEIGDLLMVKRFTEDGSLRLRVYELIPAAALTEFHYGTYLNRKWTVFGSLGEARLHYERLSKNKYE